VRRGIYLFLVSSVPGELEEGFSFVFSIGEPFWELIIFPLISGVESAAGGFISSIFSCASGASGVSTGSCDLKILLLKNIIIKNPIVTETSATLNIGHVV
jgi:hypothetical protein